MDWPTALIHMDDAAGQVRQADEALAGEERFSDARLQLLAARSCLLVAAEIMDGVLEEHPDIPSGGKLYPLSVEITEGEPDEDGTPTFSHRIVPTPGADESGTIDDIPIP